MKLHLPVGIMNMHYSGLGIARSLKNPDITIYGIGPIKNLPGNKTKYCHWILSPDSKKNREEYLNFLIDFARKVKSKPILLPTSDHDIFFIDDFRNRLDEYYHIILPKKPDLHRIMNKEALYGRLVKAGICCPKTLVINSPDQIRSIDIPPPYIVKPPLSYLWRNPEIWKIVKNKAIKINGLSQLREIVTKLSRFNLPIMIQEYVPGPDTNTVIFASYITKSKNRINFFTAKRSISSSVDCGSGVAVESAIIKDIVDPSRKILDLLDFKGISEIEFKYDEKKKAYVFIEINPRHFDQHELGKYVGVNLTRALYDDIVFDHDHAFAQISNPVVWIADFEYLNLCLKGLLQKEYPIVPLFKILKKKKIFAYYEKEDLKPFFAALKNNSKRFLRIA